MMQYYKHAYVMQITQIENIGLPEKVMQSRLVLTHDENLLKRKLFKYIELPLNFLKTPSYFTCRSFTCIQTTFWVARNKNRKSKNKGHPKLLHTYFIQTMIWHTPALPHIHI